MQLVECLEVLTLHEEGEDHIVMIMEKEDKLYNTSVIIFDILQAIAKHLIIRMMEIREEMYLYVSYVITLDTQ